jgi:hypothetical protein
MTISPIHSPTSIDASSIAQLGQRGVGPDFHRLAGPLREQPRGHQVAHRLLQPIVKCCSLVRVSSAAIGADSASSTPVTARPAVRASPAGYEAGQRSGC